MPLTFWSCLLPSACTSSGAAHKMASKAGPKRRILYPSAVLARIILVASSAGMAATSAIAAVTCQAVA